MLRAFTGRSVDGDGGLGAGLGDAGGVGDDAAIGAAGLGLDAVCPEDGGVGFLGAVKAVLQPQAVLLVGGGVAREDHGDPAAGGFIVLLPVKGRVHAQIALGVDDEHAVVAVRLHGAGERGDVLYDGDGLAGELVICLGLHAREGVVQLVQAVIDCVDGVSDLGDAAGEHIVLRPQA